MPGKRTLNELENQNYALKRELRECKQSEEALRELDLQHRMTFDALDYAISVLDCELRFVLFNEQFRKLKTEMGSDSEVIGKKIFEVFPFLPIEKICEYYRVLETGTTLHTEEKMIVGQKELFSVTLKIPVLSEGRVSRIITITRDDTKRIKAEKELRESEEKYRNLFRYANDAIFLHDLDGRIFDANSRALECFGYNRPEMLSLRLDDLYPESALEVSKVALNKIFQGDQMNFEIDFKRKNGEIFPADVSSSIFRLGDQDVVQGVVRDISSRKHRESELRSSSETLSTVLDHLDINVFVSDMKSYKILFMNRHMMDCYGYESVGLPCWYVVAGSAGPCKSCNNDQLLGADGNPAGVIVHEERDPITGKIFVYHDRAIRWTDSRIVRLQIMTDETELKKTENEKRRLEAGIREAKRMEALSTLAGGIAHEFNNLLMGIMGRSSLMLIDLDSSHPHYEHLRGIEEAVESASVLTNQLLGFAGGGKYEVKLLDLNEVVTKSLDLFSRARKDIRVEWKCGDDLWTVKADRNQIKQVIANLIVNAWQAMPEGGNLVLKTGNVTLDQTTVSPHDIKPGRYVEISVTDTGIGMDAQTRQRIFDPFFTTKKMDRRTGLGLASAYGIIKNHGGFIRVQSESGHGSTFQIFLPASDSDDTQKSESPPGGY